MANQLLTLKTIADRCVEEGDCLLWKQGSAGTGTPYAQHGGKVVNVRRLAYTLHHGRPPRDNYVLVPTCGNSLCLNAEHLKQRTRKQALQMLVEAGAFKSPAARAKRTAASRRRRTTKYTMEHARLARQMRAEGKTLREIGEVIGATKGRVSAIVTGRSWREDIPDSASSIFTLAQAA